MLASIAPKQTETTEIIPTDNEDIKKLNRKLYAYRKRMKSKRYKYDKPYCWMDVFEESTDMLTSKLNGKDLFTETSGFARSKSE